MLAVQVPVFKGEGKIAYESRPVPQVTAGDDVLVQVDACGICGTDLNILAVPPAHKATLNIVIGHEATGSVLEVGTGVKNLRPGDRVVVAPRLTCGQCRYCRMGLDNQCENYRTIGTTIDGAFAPHLLAPQAAFYKIGDGVRHDDAVFFEPLSCVVGAVARARIEPGDNVVIIGAGPMGMLFAQVYRLMGAGRVYMADVVPYRLELAGRLGVDGVLNPEEVDLAQAVRERTGIGADLVVDAVGNQVDTAVKVARRGGQVLLFGLRPHDNPPLNQYTITRFDLTVTGAFVGLKPFPQTIKLLESGRIHPGKLITHRVPLGELMRGVDLMRSGQAMKVVVEMTGQAVAEA